MCGPHKSPWQAPPSLLSVVTEGSVIVLAARASASVGTQAVTVLGHSASGNSRSHLPCLVWSGLALPCLVLSGLVYMTFPQLTTTLLYLLFTVITYWGQIWFLYYTKLRYFFLLSNFIPLCIFLLFSSFASLCFFLLLFYPFSLYQRRLWLPVQHHIGARSLDEHFHHTKFLSFRHKQCI